MANLFILLFVAIALTWANIEGRVVNKSEEYNPEQDIPDRCTENSVTEVSCENANSTHYLLPHPDDCELFYYCVSSDQEPICRQCPARLHFNPEESVCDLPERAGCTADRLYQFRRLLKFLHAILENFNNNDQSDDAEDAIVARCRNSSVTNVTCENVITPDNLVPHPDDCELFYYCVSPDQAPVCRLCPAELHFNPTEHVCDLPERAGCNANKQIGYGCGTNDFSCGTGTGAYAAPAEEPAGDFAN